LGADTVTENADVPTSSLQNPILFYPFYFTFDTMVPMTAIQVFTGAKNGHIHFTYNGIDFYGFPMSVKIKPALNDAQTWKLLCSPMMNLSDMVDLEYTGFNNLQIMALGAAIPHLSPVKFVPAGILIPAQYNFRHIDQELFINQIDFWAFKENYISKWQTNDTIEFQCVTNGLAPVVVTILNECGQQVTTINLAQQASVPVISPLILWQGTYSLVGLSPGIYSMILTAGTGTATVVFKSEKLSVATYWPRTMLLQYSDTRNKQCTIFSNGWSPSFRVEGWIDGYSPDADFTSYRDQAANNYTLYAVPYLGSYFNLGDRTGVPPWVHRLVDRILYLQTVLLDGKQFTRVPKEKWDATLKIEGWPMYAYKLPILPSENADAVVATTTGALEGGDLTVMYNIETDGFGNGSAGSNVVQVTTLSQS
jgi:hypothetical protein